MKFVYGRAKRTFGLGIECDLRHYGAWFTVKIGPFWFRLKWQIQEQL